MHHQYAHTANSSIGHANTRLTRAPAQLDPGLAVELLALRFDLYNNPRLSPAEVMLGCWLTDKIALGRSGSIEIGVRLIERLFEAHPAHYATWSRRLKKLVSEGHFNSSRVRARRVKYHPAVDPARLLKIKDYIRECCTLDATPGSAGVDGLDEILSTPTPVALRNALKRLKSKGFSWKRCTLDATRLRARAPVSGNSGKNRTTADIQLNSRARAQSGSPDLPGVDEARSGSVDIHRGLEIHLTEQFKGNDWTWIAKLIDQWTGWKALRVLKHLDYLQARFGPWCVWCSAQSNAVHAADHPLSYLAAVCQARVEREGPEVMATPEQLEAWERFDRRGGF